MNYQVTSMYLYHTYITSESVDCNTKNVIVYIEIRKSIKPPSLH